ncbi:DUF4364 family protein [Clostridium fermenticellae]|uniref:DUF4364 family protein n=1 Tax=Clostridium fermenticellae TaxID=2068654 RepID=A0A386H241_9CLOT|nr:DUF4364 family protein [Clostridium fermenticellae]AYD39759.1 DUF4364 family protein [Clostridium fermenticellae]
MFDDTLELAENKLLLLYIFNKMSFPISNNQITEIVLENNLINYFTLQQYLTELVSSNFLKYTNKTGNYRYIITNKGQKVLLLFANRIAKQKTNTVDEYLNKQIDNIKKKVTVIADYTIESENNFIVDLKTLKNDSVIIDLKLNVDSNKRAKELCEKWNKNSLKLYNKIIDLLNEE